MTPVYSKSNPPQLATSQINEKQTHIPLKTFALVGVAAGLVFATAGGIEGVYLLGKAYLASELGAKIFAVSTAILFATGAGFLYMSMALLATSSTSLGAAITFPIAATCFLIPFIPFSPGLLLSTPGIMLCCASSLAFQKIEGKESPNIELKP